MSSEVEAASVMLAPNLKTTIFRAGLQIHKSKTPNRKTPNIVHGVWSTFGSGPLSVCLCVCLSLSLSFSLSSCMAVWLSGCLPGCRAAWLPGWLIGCLSVIVLLDPETPQIHRLCTCCPMFATALNSELC